MRIDIWSDVVCPWCYIGKRRLETALSAFEHADEVEVLWRSFQLDPGAPREGGGPTAQMLARKYGMGPEQVAESQARVTALAAEEGLAYRLDDTSHVNTLDAHRVLHLALDEGGPVLQGRMKEALLAAYFTQARDVADHDVLVEVATEVGLDPERVRGVLATDELADRVWADAEQAGRYGATGVPFFVVDGRYGVSGAQPAEALGQVLTRAWAESHPAPVLLAGDPAQACGPDGCPV